MRNATQVQAALVENLANRICTDLSLDYQTRPSQAAITRYVTQWMIEMNVRFQPRPTDLLNGGKQE